MLEEERKFEVDTAFVVPDLTGCLPEGGSVVVQRPVYLRATYYDTPDRRLARAGASLRYRRGDRDPWTVKLPTAVPGVRHEISRAGAAGTVPGELIALVTAYTRGVPLEPAATLRTTRRVHHLYDAGERPLAELDDDTVSVMDGKVVREKFREIEVELREGRRKLLDRVAARLTDAGARGGAFVPKLVRALGPLDAPDVVPPAAALPSRASAADVVVQALRADIARIFAHEPLVRLREPLPGGDTAVHQMRVGVRRLRSDLRVFRPLLDTAWADELRGHLSWIADTLGAARDAEVLRARLARTAELDAVAPVDNKAVARIDAELSARHERALEALDAAMRTERYRGLLDELVRASAAPAVRYRRADRPAGEVLPRLVAKPWRKLALGSDSLGGAEHLDPTGPDEEWHEVRIRAKRARYATEAVARAVGGPATELGRQIAAVQNLLGEHQDAVVAAHTWLEISRVDPGDHTLAVTAGRLYERERLAVREVREALPAVWRRTSRRRLTEWLP